jgi:hypothetical protein
MALGFFRLVQRRRQGGHVTPAHMISFFLSNWEYTFFLFSFTPQSEFSVKFWSIPFVSE